MVKPEIRINEKPATVALEKEELKNMDKRREDDGEDVVSFKGAMRHRKPRTCTFMILLIVTVVVGFLVVYFVGISKTNG